MKTLRPIGKWIGTTRPRSVARHIASPDDGRPLCWMPGDFPNVAYWRTVEGIPTCRACKAVRYYLDTHPPALPASICEALNSGDGTYRP